MTRAQDSQSPKQKEVAEHYASGYEASRLLVETGRIDGERTRELLVRFLPAAPAIIFDVGGGPGAYACWLARRGYHVHLIDITPLHVEFARQASAAQPETPLAGANVGDACALPWSDETADAVLLFGPLYHLTDERDRHQALCEAYRVCKPGGILMAVGISRYASAMDGLHSGYLKDPMFAEIVNRDLKNGQHRNRSNPLYFMDTFFHHPDELVSEIADAGFAVTGIYGVEGPTWIPANLDEWWKDDVYRERLLQLARAVETEPSLLGVSPHLMGVGKKPLVA